jgi:glyoxylase-like metal-dependent hydrolase (beta-lactamase superfamily II)
VTAVTARTVLDAPMLPLFDDEELRWQQIRAEHNRLMALPSVTAVVDTLPKLTAAQRDRLSVLWSANYGVHRLDQLRIGHCISHAHPDHARRLRALADHVWSRAAGSDGPAWSGAHAVADAAYAAACGDLLTDDEARLFTKPWTDVIR